MTLKEFIKALVFRRVGKKLPEELKTAPDLPATNQPLKLAAPWTTLYRQYLAFFRKDDTVRVEFYEDTVAIKLRCDDVEKAIALEHILPKTRQFGNVTVNILVVPCNADSIPGNAIEFASDADAVLAALKGNKAFVGFEVINGITFIAFAKEVVQYFNDNLADLHGMTSTLYQYLADEIIEKRTNVYFNTDLGEPVATEPTPSTPCPTGVN